MFLVGADDDDPSQNRRFSRKYSFLTSIKEDDSFSGEKVAEEGVANPIVVLPADRDG
jgi:hypothetical protein